MHQIELLNRETVCSVKLLHLIAFDNMQTIAILNFVETNRLKHFKMELPTNYFAQSAGAVEYTDCFSAEG